MQCFTVWLNLFSVGSGETDLLFQEDFQTIGKNNELRQFCKSVQKFHTESEKNALKLHDAVGLSSSELIYH